MNTLQGYSFILLGNRYLSLSTIAPNIIFSSGNFVFPTGSIGIDSSFLIANTSTWGGPPYVLGKQFANYSGSSYYYLNTDISSDYSSILVGSSGVTIDLNGRYIIFNNAPRIGYPLNGGFEVGTGINVPNWDLSNAPSAVIANANDHWLFGNQCLRFISPTSTQVINSDSFFLPSSILNHSLMASVTPSWGNGYFNSGVTLFIYVVSGTPASPGPVIASNTLQSAQGATDHGTMQQCEFVPSGAGPYFIKISYVNFPSAGTSLDIDDVKISLSRDCGIICNNQGHGTTAQLTTMYNNLPAKVQTVYDNSAANLDSFTLTNSKPGFGGIIQGQNAGSTACALLANSIRLNLNVNNIISVINGDNSDHIDCGGLTNGRSAVTYINNNMFSFSGFPNIVDHFGVWSCVVRQNGAITSLNNYPINILGNTIIDQPQYGMYMNYATGFNSVVVSGNIFLPQIIVPDGASMVINGVSGFEICHNSVISLSGIWLQLEDFSPVAPTANGDIHDEYVWVGLCANREEGLGGTARCARIRNDGSVKNPYPVMQNIRIHNNDLTAIVYSTGAVSCYGLYYTQFDNNSGNYNCGLQVYNNNIAAIVYQSGSSEYWGAAFEMDGCNSGVNPAIYNNNLISNDCSISIGGPINNAYVGGANFFNNNLVYYSGADPYRKYIAIRAGDFTNFVSGIFIWDTILSSGANINNVVIRGQIVNKDIKYGFTQSIHCQNAGGSPIANATVSLFNVDNSKSVAFTGINYTKYIYSSPQNVFTSDVNGNVSGISIVTIAFSGIGSTITGIYTPILAIGMQGALSGNVTFNPSTNQTTNIVLS